MGTLIDAVKEAGISDNHEIIKIDNYFYLFYSLREQDHSNGFNFALFNIIGELVEIYDYKHLFYDPSQSVLDSICYGSYSHDGLRHIHFTPYSSDLSTDILLNTFNHLKRLESLNCPNI